MRVPGLAIAESQERWASLCSWPLCSLWVFSLAVGWLFQPIVGWLSFLPFFVGFPFSFCFTPPLPRRRPTTASIGNLKWERNDFCRGAVNHRGMRHRWTFLPYDALLHTVFQHEVDWGGLCCDEKGIYHETLVRMARKYGRQDDLLLLQTRPDHAEDSWVPSTRFNLLSNMTIPWSTYATVIVDTAAALASGAEDKGFFKTRLTLTSVEAFNSSGS